MTKSIRKITFEYADGTIRYLEGEDANKYIAHINICLEFMQATRQYMLPPDFLQVRWKERKKSK